MSVSCAADLRTRSRQNGDPAIMTGKAITMHILSPLTLVVSLSLAVSPAVAQGVSQFAAQAGVSRAGVQTLTLAEIAALKFNRDSDPDEAQSLHPERSAVAVDPARNAQLIAEAGLDPEAARGMALSDLVAAKIAREARRDDRQAGAATPGSARPNAQLIAAAGLDPEVARDMSLAEIAAAKFAREPRGDDR